MLRILVMLLFLSGCTPMGTIKVDADEEIEIEQAQLQERNLLDVGVIVFKAGEISAEQAEEEAISTEIRQAEARYISYHLRETLQKSSGWGAVNVLPSESEIADVIVEGEILESTGEKLRLKVAVSDSTGEPWFENSYQVRVTRRDYAEIDDENDYSEIYQGMYNRIANDINKHRKKLSEKQITSIRNTSELEYAANLAPEIYRDYLVQNEHGHSTVVRLPAKDDPSLLRVLKIRERENLLVDTINEHYANYYEEVHATYGNWRKYYLIESIEKRKVEREAKFKKLLGAAAILGSAVILVKDGNISPSLVIAGVSLYADGANASEEAAIHKEAIVELSESLQADVEPLVIEVDGETTELTGTLDEQYLQWRALLQAIYKEEVGIPDATENKSFSDT
ncbi:MAG: hypothetical protein AB8C40_00290 [Gammaproteobacteria bacterium]